MLADWHAAGLGWSLATAQGSGAEYLHEVSATFRAISPPWQAFSISWQHGPAQPWSRLRQG